MSDTAKAITEHLDDRALLQIWDHASDRHTWEKVRRNGQEAGDVERVRVAEGALAEIPEVTALDALKANARLVQLMIGRRWYVMRDAREAGASWDEIGAAVDMSGDDARDYYRQEIELQEKVLPDLHDAARSRAVLDDETLGATRP
jgi:hypothetical protein